MQNAQKIFFTESAKNPKMANSRIERTFRSLKSELGLRPIYHQKDDRIEAHLFLSVLAYYGVHVIRTKLKEAHIDDSWDTIRSELCTRRRDGRIIRKK